MKTAYNRRLSDATLRNGKTAAVSWVLSVLRSSVGRKLVMGLTGLALSAFLVVHLAGNTLLFVGPEAYDKYAALLHSQPELLLLAEIGLWGAFFAHAYIAYALTKENWRARPRSYKGFVGKRDDRIGAGFIAPEKWMAISGTVVLGFTILHVAEFKFEWGWGSQLEPLSPYQQAVAILGNPLRKAIYVAGCVLLGVHVSHGFQSGWQSLGVNHEKINGLLKYASFGMGLLVAVGFSLFPVLHGAWDDPTYVPAEEFLPHSPTAAIEPAKELID